MIHPFFEVLKPVAAAVFVLTGVAAAAAQQREARPSDVPASRLEALERDTSNFFGQLFGGGERSGPSESPIRRAQLSQSELVVRLERMENQIRQLTGLVEQLQFRNQQLESQIRRMNEGSGAVPRPQAPPPAPGAPGVNRSDVLEPSENPAPGALRPSPRRSDVFDPSEHPNAPGAPRVMGSLPSGPSVITGDPGDDGPPVGAPGGRQAGAPLDLSTLSDRPASDPRPGGPPASGSALPPPPPRNPSATGSFQQQAMLPPTASAKDEYDLAYGYILRKDYAQAEEGFRAFLRKYPSDRMTAEANYWLGESLFQRQRYRDAAESFLSVSTKFDKSPKAPDSLLRLGQSLAALKEKEAACATLLEIGRKYPRASPTVRQGVEREQKRVGC